MPFRLQKNTKEWFSEISKAFQLDFDIYYLCLMAGLAKHRKRSLDNEGAETTELVDNFPGPYREKGRVITALFMSRELKALGVQAQERNALNKSIASYIDPHGASLGETGMREMNRYAYGGAQVLTEWFDEKPRDLVTFLPRYAQLLRDAIENKEV